MICDYYFLKHKKFGVLEVAKPANPEGQAMEDCLLIPTACVNTFVQQVATAEMVFFTKPVITAMAVQVKVISRIREIFNL